MLAIKQQVMQVLPDATVILFGSQANNTANEESDWDILVITDRLLITNETKKIIHNRIFPLSVSIAAFINLVIVTKKDWQENPSYYSLKQSVAFNNKAL